MDLGIRDRVAIVGGASQGLGQACASLLAQEGAHVVVSARRPAPLEAAAEEIRRMGGGDVLPVAADWSRAEDIDRVAAAALETFGRIDILVHNTGGPPAGGFFDHPDADWQSAFELLLLSAVRMYRAVIPSMRANRWGRITNIASITVKEPWETLILSNVFRAGVVSLAKTLSRETAADNILINTVCPGLYRTQRLEAVMGRQAEEAGVPVETIIDRSAQDIPRGRLGTPDELARLVVFLSSEAASNITGTTVQADGGMVKGLL